MYDNTGGGKVDSFVSEYSEQSLCVCQMRLW